MSTPAANSSRKMLISLPVFWQVMGLSFAVLVLALVIPVLVVLMAPEPPPSGYSLTEVVTALRKGEVRLQNGRWLKAETVSSKPDFVDQKSPVRNMPGQRSNFEADLVQKLASELNVPADTLFVHFQMRRRMETIPRQLAFRPDSFNNGPNFIAPPGFSPPQGMFGPMPQDASRQPLSDEAASSGAAAEADTQPLPPSGSGPAGNPGMPPYTPDAGPNNGPNSGPGNFPGNRIVTMNGETRAETFYPAFSVAWQLKDDTWRVINPPKDWIAPWQQRLLFSFLITAVLILPLAWWLSRRLARPIIAFSEAASKLSVEENAPPVLAVGPREVRAAAEVLNDMQTRIKKQMESRTALMGAIAHDLKTPLARMRLRIEDLPAPIREKLNGDIAHMDGLIRSAMSFTSAHKMGETLRPLDLSALVESLSDDLCAVCDMEPAQIEDNIMVKGDALGLKRVLINLVENAGRYAGGCRVELSSRGNKAELRIIDTGPGLPPDALEAVFEPFYRLESSRSRDTGGTGLGLSVARALTEAQGGTLTAHNRYAGDEVVGLELRMVLPRLMKS
ncbi:MAG: HAMP domain-containing sensor histidine kinase [Asticcacaulis sp.]|uniref:sensor histidine kinase n=1 Tax=Asticcacaulis sp. TaxID=1872648 RepID=UPI0039E44A77